VAENARKLTEPDMQNLFQGYYYNRSEALAPENPERVTTTGNAKTV